MTTAPEKITADYCIQRAVLALDRGDSQGAYDADRWIALADLMAVRDAIDLPGIVAERDQTRPTAAEATAERQAAAAALADQEAAQQDSTEPASTEEPAQEVTA